MKKPYLIAVITVLAAVIAGTVLGVLAARSDELGERFVDHRRKLTFFPPAGWLLTAPPEDLRRHFSRPGTEYSAHFEGPNPGDQCDLMVANNRDRLAKMKDEQAKMKPEAGVQVNEFVNDIRFINGVPAWVHEYSTKMESMLGYTVKVVLDRGDTKIVLSYAGSPKSIQQQAKSISKSFNSIRLD